MKNDKKKYNKSAIFILIVVILLVAWAVLAAEYGEKLVTWIMVVIIPALIIIVYWRFVQFRKPIKKIYDVLLDLFLSLFENENSDSKPTGNKGGIPKYASVDAAGKEYKKGFERIRLEDSLKEEVARNAKNRCQIWERSSRRGRCGVTDRYPMQIHHINGKPGVNKIENLLYVCSNHHNVITKAFKWREIEKGSGNYKYTSNSKIHRSYFKYCRTNDGQNIQKLDEKYFELFKIQITRS